MKKLIYSTLGLIMATSLVMTGCKDPDDGGTTKPTPTVTFKNTAGYTSQDVTVNQGTAVKFGMVVTSDIDIKSITVTRNYMGAGEVIIKSQSSINAKSFSIDVLDTASALLKGNFVYTFKAIDKDGTEGSAKITMKVTGPLTEITAQQVFNNKGAGFGAYDLLNSETISTADASNAAMRDIIDNSTTSVISASWKSGNSTRFIKGPFTSQWSQVDTEEKLKSLWDSNVGTNNANVKDVLTGLTDGTLVLVKVSRSSAPIYIMLRIVTVNDIAGADGDYIEFDYKY